MLQFMSINQTPIRLADLLEGIRQPLPDITRPVWRFHDNFNDLLDFWLRRHGAFRSLMTDLSKALEEFGTDGPDIHEEEQLMEMWSLFREQLKQHQDVEDSVYFPVVLTLNPAFELAFERLSEDHDALLDCIAAVEDAEDSAGMMEAMLILNDKLLGHMEAEEDLVMPLVLETPPPLEFVVYDEDGNEVGGEDLLEDEDEDSLAYVTKN